MAVGNPAPGAAAGTPAPRYQQPGAGPAYPVPGYSPYPPYPPYPPPYAYAYAQPYPSYAPYPYDVPYGYPYPYPYPYPYGYPARPPRAPGETYSLVIAWIVVVLGALSIVSGGLLLLVLLLAATNGSGGSLSVLTTFSGFTLGPIVGGVLAIFYGVRRIINRASPAPRLPRVWLMAGMTAVALVAGVALWHVYTSPGPALAVLPLVLLSGFLPALTILSYGVRELGAATTRRHLWLSLFWGATLAPLLAIIAELVATILIALGFSVVRSQLSPGITDINTSPQSGADILFMFLVLAVVAPLVEEALKPLGVVLILPRVASAAEAFLLGLAAGLGFAMLETVGYIGSGEADWISIALQRIGAGLLHGVGAAIAALGWYLIFKGKGVPRRWLKGFGALAYAVVQHSWFNGSNLLVYAPDPIGDWMSRTLYLGRLPLDSGTLLFFAYYVIILGVLVYVVRRLRRGLPASVTAASPAPPPPSKPEPEPQAVAGGAR